MRSFRYETCLGTDRRRRVYRVYRRARHVYVGVFHEVERGKQAVYPVAGSPLDLMEDGLRLVDSTPLAKHGQVTTHQTLRKAIRATCRHSGIRVLVIRFPQDETGRTWTIVGTVAAVIAAIASVAALFG